MAVPSGLTGFAYAVSAVVQGRRTTDLKSGSSSRWRGIPDLDRLLQVLLKRFRHW
jgi:hypothetical protein